MLDSRLLWMVVSLEQSWNGDHDRSCFTLGKMELEGVSDEQKIKQQGIYRLCGTFLPRSQYGIGILLALW